MAGTIEGRVNYNWHIADDVLVGSKVRYLSNFSAAPHFGERLESARLAHCPEPRRRSLDRAETGRSALGTALHAPHLPFARLWWPLARTLSGEAAKPR